MAQARAGRRRHFHCKVFVYRAVEDKQFADSVEFDLIDEDPQIAIERAAKMAENSTNDEGIVRKRWTLRYVNECFDSAHAG